VEGLPLAVTVCDASKAGCPFVFVNRAYENMTGYGRNELLGRGLSTLSGVETDRSQVGNICIYVLNPLSMYDTHLLNPPI
jgi:PAS domain S-box-containing protein